MNTSSQLIVALDVDTFEEARTLIETLGDHVHIYKVGSQLFTACGPVIVRHLLAHGKKVFLDLKWHDIPNTVANAAAAAVGLGKEVHEMGDPALKGKKKDGGLFLCTVHTLGGAEMLEKTVASATKMAQDIGVKAPHIIGITVLTSEAQSDNISELVLQRARLAKKSGLDGVVASAQEASLIRKKFGNDFLIVTPGIRPEGADVNDQKRVTTPLEAISNGSNFLVVGRPVVKAEDPLGAAKRILEEIKQAS